MKWSERGKVTEGCVTCATLSIRPHAASKPGGASTFSVERGFGAVLWEGRARGVSERAGCSGSVDSCAAEMNDLWLKEIETCHVAVFTHVMSQ